MIAQEKWVHPTKQQSIGYHTCNADYGWCGEHRAFRAHYTCPACGASFPLQQCAAWPITSSDCPKCGQIYDWSLNQTKTKAILR